MASSRNSHGLGLEINSPIVSNKGNLGAFSILASQIEWGDPNDYRDINGVDENNQYTMFGGMYTYTSDGVTQTEKLLNTIEKHIDNKFDEASNSANEAANNHQTYTSTYTIVKQSYQMVMNTYLSTDGIMSYCVMDIWGEL